MVDQHLLGGSGIIVVATKRRCGRLAHRVGCHGRAKDMFSAILVRPGLRA